MRQKTHHNETGFDARSLGMSLFRLPLRWKFAHLHEQLLAHKDR